MASQVFFLDAELFQYPVVSAGLNLVARVTRDQRSLALVVDDGVLLAILERAPQLGQPPPQFARGHTSKCTRI